MEIWNHWSWRLAEHSPPIDIDVVELFDHPPEKSKSRPAAPPRSRIMTSDICIPVRPEFSVAP